jgi:hypothetical protein
MFPEVLPWLALSRLIGETEKFRGVLKKHWIY